MRYFLIIIYSLTISSNAIAWGQNGHRIIGQIAYNHLSNKVQKHIATILEGQSIAMVSTFMDEIKSDPKYDFMGPWHYCTIPDGEAYDSAPEEGDVIQAINTYIKQLKSGTLSGREEAFVLKCLIHVIGDIHQPLHVGNGTDRGGNDTKVTYFREPSNLHWIWDSGIIEGKSLSYTEYVAWIDMASATQIEQWKRDDIMVWTKESISYRPQIYDLPENNKINYRYNYDNIATVNLRLLQAGIRLAGVLDEIYS